MPRRPARLPATPRADDPETGRPTAEAKPLPVERRPGSDDPAHDAPVDDTAFLGAYALGALSPEERAAVEERLAADPELQSELRRLIPVAALLREATPGPPRAATQPDKRPDTSQVPDAERAADPQGGPVSRPVGKTTSKPALAAEPEPAAPVMSSAPFPAMSSDVEASPSSEPDDMPEPAGDVHTLSVEDEPVSPELTLDDIPVETTAGVSRVEAAPGSLSSRPARRRAVGAGTAEPRPARASTTVASWPPSWIAASLVTLVAVGAVLWALALVDRLDARQQEIDALGAELSQLRQRGDAAVVTLAPAEGGPAEADGVVVVVPSEGSLVVRASGLPPSAEGRVYQLWFQDQPADRWLVGPVFRVGDAGTALAELPAAAPPFVRIAISEEASPGGDEPSGAFLLEGTVAAMG